MRLEPKEPREMRSEARCEGVVRLAVTSVSPSLSEIGALQGL